MRDEGRSLHEPTVCEYLISVRKCLKNNTMETTSDNSKAFLKYQNT